MKAAHTFRQARHAAGLSLRQLAERAGTSHATLAAYEAGRSVPRLDTLDRILRAAGYATDIDMVHRPDATAAERRAKGEEFRQALELAAMFPARHAKRLRFPPSRPAGRVSQPGLPEQMLAIHEHLQRAGIDHAFGGALALAWCTQQARGTIDLDVNVFTGPDRTDEVLAALPGTLSPATQTACSRTRRSGAPVVGHHARRRVPEHHPIPRTRRVARALGAVRRRRNFRSSRAKTSPCSRRSSTAQRLGRPRSHARRRHARHRGDRRRAGDVLGRRRRTDRAVAVALIGTRFVPRRIRMRNARTRPRRCSWGGTRRSSPMMPGFTDTLPALVIGW